MAGHFGAADGAGSHARFFNPYSLAVDRFDNLYIADTYNHTLRKISAAGVVSTLAGDAGHYGSADGIGRAARFYLPSGVTVDESGNLFVADSFNDTVREVTSAGAVTTLGGSAAQIGNADGIGPAARFAWPTGIVVKPDGTLYLTDSRNGTIREAR